MAAYVHMYDGLCSTATTHHYSLVASCTYCHPVLRENCVFYYSHRTALLEELYSATKKLAPIRDSLRGGVDGFIAIVKSLFGNMRIL